MKKTKGGAERIVASSSPSSCCETEKLLLGKKWKKKSNFLSEKKKKERERERESKFNLVLEEELSLLRLKASPARPRSACLSCFSDSSPLLPSPLPFLPEHKVSTQSCFLKKK